MMLNKTSVYLLLVVFFAGSTFTEVYAQETVQKPFVYGQVGLEGGNFGGVSLAGTYIFPSKYVVQVGYQFSVSSAKERPADYHAGAIDLLTLGISSAKDTYNIFQVSFGKILELNKHPKTRFNLLGGLGVSFGTKATNFEFDGTAFGLDPNYSFNTENATLLIVLVQPKIEFCLSHRNGISVGPVLKITERETLYGFSVNYIFGRLRNEIAIIE
ncbi:MAG: hypothetical protein CMC70_12110 [Flavobacteriaceae bacterium]|nr:hypothetical protein [Flavobacteriaceae bacterium]